MKILIFNNLYKPFARGGAERVVERLADEFTAQGHELLVATALPLGKSQPAAVGVHYFRGLPSLFYHLESLPKTLRLLFHLLGYVDPCVYRQTKKLLRSFRPDLVITNNLVGLGLSSLCAIKQDQAKHVHILHDIQLLHPSGLMMWGGENLIRSWAAKRYQALNGKYFSKAHLVVSPSQWLLDLHLGQGLFGRTAHEVIANPANPERATPPEPRSSATIDCLYVGQLERHKGIDFLLAAFKRLPSDYRLRIAGSGSQEVRVLDAAKHDSRIVFLGRLSPEQVATEMRQDSALIVPSLCYENSPTVIYEAMSQGLPIVAAKLGGIPELITDEQNLFAPGDQQSLERTLTGPFNRNQALPQDKAITIERYVNRMIEKIKAL
jgi:glycosyltransferase involved in cell wall biosynthesis